MALDELRAARELTQTHLAELFGVSQGSISRLERRTDMYVSTLAKFIEAMGGQLEIRAVFPDGTVRINQFAGDANRAA
jgi:transcriptional regulator with XRE-family HTH domain